MIRISAVSYLNTLPFIYGIENAGFLKPEEYILSREIPSECAKKIENNEADLVLMPVAVLAKHNYNIVSDYCIGANKSVLSVLLVSQCSIDNITDVLLDYQSKTSVNLIKVLAKFYWNKNFNWIDAKKNYENKIVNTTAGVIIGDRALELSDNYKYKYDLATEWNKFTGLPFVFACWVTNKNLDKTFLSNFNKSLNWGIKNINNIKPHYNRLTDDFVKNYFKNNIEYKLSEKMHEAIALFIKHLQEV